MSHHYRQYIYRNTFYRILSHCPEYPSNCHYGFLDTSQIFNCQHYCNKIIKVIRPAKIIQFYQLEFCPNVYNIHTNNCYDIINNHFSSEYHNTISGITMATCITNKHILAEFYILFVYHFKPKTKQL